MFSLAKMKGSELYLIRDSVGLRIVFTVGVRVGVRVRVRVRTSL